MTSFAIRLLLGALAFTVATPAFAADKPRVAVLYFDATSTDPMVEGLGVGLAQMLITDLAGEAEFDVVERTKIQAILDELMLGHDGIADPSQAAQIGKLLGARYLLLGGYMKLANTLRIDARLVEVETSKILGAKGTSGSIDTVFGMEAELAEFARDSLLAQVKPTGSRGGTETAAAPVIQPVPAAAAQPGDPAEPAPVVVKAVAPKGRVEAMILPDPEALDAAIAFSEGLIAMDSGNKPAAREHFQRAVAADSQLTDAADALASLDL